MEPICYIRYKICCHLSRALIRLFDPSDKFFIYFFDAGEVDFVLAHATRRLRYETVSGRHAFHVQAYFYAAFAGWAEHGKLFLAAETDIALP